MFIVEKDKLYQALKNELKNDLAQFSLKGSTQLNVTY